MARLMCLLQLAAYELCVNLRHTLLSLRCWRHVRHMAQKAVLQGWTFPLVHAALPSPSTQRSMYWVGAQTPNACEYPVVGMPTCRTGTLFCRADHHAAPSRPKLRPRKLPE